MKYVLETKNLTKKYGKFRVLDNLNMHIPKNSIYGLIGKNGVGKTTLIRVICGLQGISGGEFTLYGVKNNSREFNKMRSRIGAIIEHPAIYMELSAVDNLMVQFKLVGNPNYEEINKLLKLVDLDTNSKKVRYFSLGMRQRLGIAMSLVNHPDFLILDEPINGLDPEGIIEIRELLVKLNREKNITILISSHYLDELSKIATYYGFMENGRIVKEVSSSELERNLKKRVDLKIIKTSEVIPVLESLKIDYEVIDKDNISLFGDIDIQEVLAKLRDKNIKVLKVDVKNETLESYFISLLGGSND